MIAISAGMPKSGTAWYFNMANDMFIAAGRQDARAIRKRYRLQSVLRFQNCNIERLTARNLMAVALPHMLGNSFVVKTHAGPTPAMQRAHRLGIVKVTYIFRDPRDAMLSALEHGRRLRAGGENHTFAALHTLGDALKRSKWWLEVWDGWTRWGQAYCVRYEDLLANPAQIMLGLAGHLSLRISPQQVEGVVKNYQPQAVSTQTSNLLHLNKAQTGRFRQSFTAEEIAMCQEHLGKHLERMGYPVN